MFPLTKKSAKIRGYVPETRLADRQKKWVLFLFPRATSRLLSNFPRETSRVRMSELNSLLKIWICPGFSKGLHTSRSRSGCRRSTDSMWHIWTLQRRSGNVVSQSVSTIISPRARTVNRLAHRKKRKRLLLMPSGIFRWSEIRCSMAVLTSYWKWWNSRVFKCCRTVAVDNGPVFWC